MKTFIYNYSEGRTPGDGSGRKKTVRIWVIKRNKPEFVIEHTDTFVDEFQLVMDALQRVKALPKASFQRGGPSNTRKYQSAFTLREAGIADVIRLD